MTDDEFDARYVAPKAALPSAWLDQCHFGDVRDVLRRNPSAPSAASRWSRPES